MSNYNMLMLPNLGKETPPHLPSLPGKAIVRNNKFITLDVLLFNLYVCFKTDCEFINI